MGFFSKHKKEEESTDTVAPPKSLSDLSSSESMNTPPAPSSEDTGNIAPPPVPGSTLEDIKSQVSSVQGARTPVGNSQNGMENNTQETAPQQDSSFDIDDSLFDMSDLETESNSNDNEEPSSPHEETPEFNDTTVDTNMNRSGNLNFISSKNHFSKPGGDSYFVTTEQFKTLLEIIDSVKNKVKESSETHLRLLDIKSEEDIEYENLRKDFQFIEDKLYELDSIIFEK